MTNTSKFPVATRMALILLGLLNLALFVLHMNIVAPTNSNKRQNATILIFFNCLLASISYFITFREIEWRYDHPVKGQNYGQEMQNLRVARTVLQLIAHTFLYAIICLITDERVKALNLPQKFNGWLAKRFEGFLIAVIFVIGLTRVVLMSWSYRTFYDGLISWEAYQNRLVIGREIGHAWVILSGVFAINLMLRAINHIINLRRMELGDSVCERLVFVISPLLLIRTATLVVVTFVLPNLLGTSIGEITGSPPTLPSLNDPTVTDSNVEYLELISQVTIAAELLFINGALVWLLSKYAWYHWELKDVSRKLEEQTKVQLDKTKDTKDVTEVV